LQAKLKSDDDACLVVQACYAELNEKISAKDAEVAELEQLKSAADPDDDEALKRMMMLALRIPLQDKPISLAKARLREAEDKRDLTLSLLRSEVESVAVQMRDAMKVVAAREFARWFPHGKDDRFFTSLVIGNAPTLRLHALTSLPGRRPDEIKSLASQLLNGELTDPQPPRQSPPPPVTAPCLALDDRLVTFGEMHGAVKGRDVSHIN
jgi:hypothetical protein